MKLLFMSLAAAVLLSNTALAGANPDVQACIDFDPPNMLHRLDPEPLTQFDAYLVLSNVEAGFTAVSFKLTETPGFSYISSYAILVPGDLPL